MVEFRDDIKDWFIYRAEPNLVEGAIQEALIYGESPILGALGYKVDKKLLNVLKGDYTFTDEETADNFKKYLSTKIIYGPKKEFNVLEALKILNETRNSQMDEGEEAFYLDDCFRKYDIDINDFNHLLGRVRKLTNLSILKTQNNGILRQSIINRMDNSIREKRRVRKK